MPSASAAIRSSSARRAHRSFCFLGHYEHFVEEVLNRGHQWHKGVEKAIHVTFRAHVRLRGQQRVVELPFLVLDKHLRVQIETRLIARDSHTASVVVQQQTPVISRDPA